MPHHPGVVKCLGKLKRSFDILTSSFVVALPPEAAGPPVKSFGTKEIAWHSGALCELESLREQPDRGRDARDRVAADTQPKQRVCALKIGEARGLAEFSRSRQNFEGFPDVAPADQRLTFADEGPKLQLTKASRANRRAKILISLHRLIQLPRLGQRLGASKAGLHTVTTITGDAIGEKPSIYA